MTANLTVLAVHASSQTIDGTTANTNTLDLPVAIAPTRKAARLAVSACWTTIGLTGTDTKAQPTVTMGVKPVRPSKNGTLIAFIVPHEAKMRCKAMS